MSYIGNQVTQSAFITDTFSGTGSQTAFTMSVAPAGTTSMLVVVSGVLQDPSTYAVTGTTLNFTAAPPSGTANISVRYLGVPATGVVNQAYRTLTEFTATAGQTTFTPPAYTVNYINVYRNGVLLGTADYTATNGTSVVLAAGCVVGDLVAVESFYVASVLNAIPNTVGSVTATNLGNGIVGAFNLNTTGTASTSTFLRGDMSWSIPGLNWQSTQTTGFTAVAGRAYPCNTTSGAFTVTLPATPTLGDQIAILDYAGTFATYNLTLGRNGNKINGIAANEIMSTNREAIIITYIDSTQGWVVSSAAYTTSPIAPPTYTASYLIVAGGGGAGGGGAPDAYGGGGGGAGGYVTGTTTLTTGTTYSVTVGGGGTGGPATTSAVAGTSGSNSTFTGLTTAVGGGGGGIGGPGTTSGGSGGSGGGSASSGTGGSGTPGQGNSGGGSATASPFYGSGGGGGSGSAGSSGTTTVGGNGGSGTASSITGTPVTYAGGGGGGTDRGGTVGLGGAPGANAGTSNGGNGSSASANTGGGGGGSSSSLPNGAYSGGNGGSGIVILSVPTASYSGTTTGSPTITTSGSNTIISWTSTGSGSYTA